MAAVTAAGSAAPGLGTTVLSLRGVRRVFGENPATVALAHADLDVHAGEVLAVLGPSGSGKSTLLNLMGLLDRPSEGSIRLLGRDVAALSERERDTLRGRHIGFVFQSSHLLGHVSTAANVGFGLTVQGVRLADRTDRQSELLGRFGLDHRAETPGRLLSGGERQRAALARSVAGRPALVLADEPTGSLDSSNAAAVKAHLRELAGAGAAVVVITHDPSVAAIADRRATMRDGVLTVETSPAPGSPAALSPAPAGSDDGVPALPQPELARAPWASRLADACADAVNSLWAQQLRSVLLVAAFVLGVGGLVAATGLAATTSAQVSTRIDSAALDTVRFRDLRETPASASSQAAVIPSPAQIRAVEEAVRGLDGVTSVRFIAEPAQPVPVTRLAGVPPEPPADPATDPAAESRQALRAVAESGHTPPLWNTAEGGAQVILGSEAATALGVLKAGPGQVVYVNGTPGAVVRILAPSGDATADHTVTINPVLAARAGGFSPSYRVSTLPGYPNAVGEAVSKTLSPDRPPAIELQTTADLKTLKRGVGGDLALMVGLLSGVLLLLAALTAATSMHISVVSRTGEIALRRALGQSRGAVGRQFVLEGSLLGFLGGLGGVIVGTAAVVALSAAQGWAPVLDPARMTLVGLGTGLGVGALASVLPASKAARMEPAEGLRA